MLYPDRTGAVGVSSAALLRGAAKLKLRRDLGVDNVCDREAKMHACYTLGRSSVCMQEVGPPNTHLRSRCSGRGISLLLEFITLVCLFDVPVVRALPRLAGTWY